MKYQISSSTGWGQRQIQGRGTRGPDPAVPLFLYQTEARRAEKIFFGDQPHPPPPRSQGLDDRLPPVILKIWIRHSVGVGVDRKFGSCSMCRFQLSSVIVGIDVMWFL